MAIMDLFTSLQTIVNERLAKDVRQAIHDGVYRANQVADENKDLVDRVAIRQDAVEQFNNQMIAEMTDKDVISAPEIIQMRDGEATANDRIIRDISQIEQEIAQAEVGIYATINNRGVDVNLSFPRLAPEVTDSDRIQRAIDNLGASGGTLIFPNANYTLYKPITWQNSNIKFQGMGRGTVFQPTDDFSENALMRSLYGTDRTSGALENVVIEGITFYGKSKNIAGIIATGFTRSCKIRDNIFMNFLGDCIYLAGSWSFAITGNNLVGEGTGKGIVLGLSGYGEYDGTAMVNQANVSGNTVRNFGTGIDLGYGNNLSVISNTIELNAINIRVLGMKSVTIMSNYIEYSTTAAILLGGTENTVSDSLIIGNFFYVTQGATIRIYGLTNSTIDRNSFGTETDNIMVSTGGTIKDNYFRVGSVSGFGTIIYFNNFWFNTATNVLRGYQKFDGQLGFFGADSQSKKTVTGSTTEAKLDSLISALTQYGLIE